MLRTLTATCLVAIVLLASQRTARAQGCDERVTIPPPSNYVRSAWDWSVWPWFAPAYARAYVFRVPEDQAIAKWYDGEGSPAFPPGDYWWRVRARCYDTELREAVWCASLWIPPTARGGGDPPRPPDAHWECPSDYPIMTETAEVQVAGPPPQMFLTW